MAIQQEKEIEIRHLFSPSLEPKPTTHFAIIKANPHEVHLLFACIRPPLIAGTPEQIAKQMTSLDHIDAVFTTELVMSTSRFEEFAEQVNVIKARIVAERPQS